MGGRNEGGKHMVGCVCVCVWGPLAVRKTKEKKKKAGTQVGLVWSGLVWFGCCSASVSSIALDPFSFKSTFSEFLFILFFL